MHRIFFLEFSLFAFLQPLYFRPLISNFIQFLMDLLELLSLFEGFVVPSSLLLTDVSAKLDGTFVYHDSLLFSVKCFFTDQSFDKALCEHVSFLILLLTHSTNDGALLSKKSFLLLVFSFLFLQQLLEMGLLLLKLIIVLSYY